MHLTSRDYQEKRDFLRLRVETQVEVAVDQQTTATGICHNLSGGGMLISLAQSIPLGTQIQVTVRSNYGHTPLLSAITQVQRVTTQSSAKGHGCLMGLKIVRIVH